MTPSHFSSHGHERVEQRLTLPAEEVTALLDEHRTLDIGTEKGTARAHHLFFSSTDDAFFVAIRHRTSGAVITVVTEAQHNELAWKISDAQKEEARALASGPAREEQGGETRLVVPVRSQELEVRILAGKSHRTLSLGRWPVVNDIREILHDGHFADVLAETLSRYSGRDVRIESVACRRGGSGAAVPLPRTILDELRAVAASVLSRPA